jgi:hypothetical protein
MCLGRLSEPCRSADLWRGRSAVSDELGPRLAAFLRDTFRTDDLSGLQRRWNPVTHCEEFRLGDRQCGVDEYNLHLLDPPPNPEAEGLKALIEAQWDAEKRVARREQREPTWPPQ